VSDIQRESLLKIASLVRPALAKTNYIPTLQHIRFDGKFATAFNDISAISVRADVELERCLPGETLIKALGSFNAKEVSVQQNDAEVVLKSGRSRMKLPTLPTKDFPLQWPDDDGDDIDLEPAIVKGIERCLINVGNDPTHPECMGVTLDSDEGVAVLFSTDNFTISRYTSKSKVKLPGGAPVILPTFFCEQLVALAKMYNEEGITLTIRGGSLMATFGKQAKLLTRTLVDKEPLDFPSMFGKQLKGLKEVTDAPTIPDSFDSALQRALLILEPEVDKVTTVGIVEGGFTMHSTSNMGDADDKMSCEDDVSFGAPEELHVDPTLVARAAKVCTRIGFLKGSMVLADKDAQFVHLVAYCAK
jgi:DNA polymerase III sliding clamp (beta) subunit (PCNA family)